jgi:hypothetical protein
MATTFIKIATVTVGSGGAASIDFTSIPSTYTDLCMKVSIRNATSFRNVTISFNNSTANFTLTMLRGDGSSTPDSGTRTGFGFNSFGYAPLNGTDTANTFNNAELYIPNYASSNFKSSSLDSVTENNGTLAYAILQANLWSQTAAINQLTIAPFSGTFTQYSTATLYGIKNS